MWAQVGIYIGGFPEIGLRDRDYVRSSRATGNYADLILHIAHHGVYINDQEVPIIIVKILLNRANDILYRRGGIIQTANMERAGI